MLLQKVNKTPYPFRSCYTYRLFNCIGNSNSIVLKHIYIYSERISFSDEILLHLPGQTDSGNGLLPNEYTTIHIREQLSTATKPLVIMIEFE